MWSNVRHGIASYGSNLVPSLAYISMPHSDSMVPHNSRPSESGRLSAFAQVLVARTQVNNESGFASVVMNEIPLQLIIVIDLIQ